MNDTNDSDTVRDTLIDLEPYSDTELDEAMRELMAIEAAERDLAVLQEVARRQAPKRGFSSRIAAWLTAAVVTAIPAAALAQDAPKPKRPTMCLTGKAISGDGFVGYVCLDGKRPKVFTRFIEVRFTDENGAPKSYVLGWTAPVKRTASGGYVAEGTPVTGGMKL